MVTLIKKHVDWEKIGVTAVRTAYNAQSAKRRVQENNIDLIICDIEMPQENGLVFLGWVKEHYPEISTIILTAYPEFHYAQTAISLGVKRYLLKPISFAELSETVKETVEEIIEQKKVTQVYEGVRKGSCRGGTGKKIFLIQQKTMEKFRGNCWCGKGLCGTSF